MPNRHPKNYHRKTKKEVEIKEEKVIPETVVLLQDKDKFTALINRANEEVKRKKVGKTVFVISLAVTMFLTTLSVIFACSTQHQHLGTWMAVFTLITFLVAYLSYRAAFPASELLRNENEIPMRLAHYNASLVIRPHELRYNFWAHDGEKSRFAAEEKWVYTIRKKDVRCISYVGEFVFIQGRGELESPKSYAPTAREYDYISHAREKIEVPCTFSGFDGKELQEKLRNWRNA